MKRARIYGLLPVALLVIITFLYCACTQCAPVTERHAHTEITLVTYNTQTFFDAIEKGSEFKAFRGSKSRWTAEKYKTRLTRLQDTLFAAGEKLNGQKQRLPDIAVLQEIENESVVQDLSKLLSRSEHYPYALCPPRSNGAFTTVILSKYPIENFFIHELHTVYKADLRPLLEAILNIGSETHPQLLTVFTVHWKSKSRGGHASAAIRAMQEEQLAKKIQEHRAKKPHNPFIVCGDFNQQPEEFTLLHTFASCWDIDRYREKAEEGAQPCGSYYFKGRWEKIDHIFYETHADAGSADSGTESTGKKSSEFDDTPGTPAHKSTVIQPDLFFVLYEPPLIENENGVPVRYDVLTGKGYSDHLPLCFRFTVDS